MKLFFAQLRNILTALAVGSMSAVVLVAPAGLGAAPAEAVTSYFLCHATGNADSHTEVKNWVYNEPSSSGDAMGHAGIGHQNGLDIIPPIPEENFPGQNWDAYGQQVHALGCKVPVTVSATFTDNRCDGTTYVAPTMTAPTYEGTTRNITGSVEPGATVTVTYTAKSGYGIVGQSTFTHTYPALPSSAAYCNRPTDQTVYDSRTSCNFATDFPTSGFEPGTIRRTGTREYVWNATTQEWVLEPESGIAWNVWTQVAADIYTDVQYQANCAPTRPPAETVHDSRERCDFTGFGDFEPGIIRRTGEREYVWNLTAREWQLEPMADVSWNGWTQAADDVYTDQEYFDNCAPTQPPAEPTNGSQEGCDLSAFGAFEAGIIRRTGERAHVWNLSARAWELEPVSDIDWNAWTQAADDIYTDDEYELLCSGEQPPAETVPDSRTDCDLSGYGEFEPGTIRREGEQDYVWNRTTRGWVLEPEAGIEWGAWTQSEDDVYTDEEFFENCALAQPVGLTVNDSEQACDLTQFGAFEAGIIRRTGTQDYVWNLTARIWELEPEADIAWNAWTQAEDDVYTDQEFFETCAPDQPTAATVDDSQEGCDLTQFGAFEAGTIRRTGDREYVWNLTARAWEPESMASVAWHPWTQVEDDVYTDQEYFDNCAPDQPADQTVTETQTACDLTGFGDFEPGTITRTGDREYVWNIVTRDWEPEPMANVAWHPWTQAEDDVYTDGEYFEACAPDQPSAATVDDSEEGCDLSQFGDFEAGIIRRTGEREYVWNLAAREWQLESMADVTWAGWTQSGDDEYTDDEYALHCSGDQPAALPVQDSTSGCDLTNLGDFQPGMLNRAGLQEYVWNVATRAWVLEPAADIAWGPWTQGAGDVYTDEEYFEACAPDQPPAVTVAEDVTGCDLTEFGAFDAGTIRRTGAREYVWNLAARAWELEAMTGVAWNAWTQVAEDVLTDEEYFASCAEVQPAAEVRQVSGTEDSCALRGTLSWTETYTTPYVWDPELRAWVLGQEGEPVREEQVDEWSQEKYERLCLDVAGEEEEVQVMDHELAAEVEVKGVQETAVPTAVDAGLGTTPFTPVGTRRNPLALVAIGGGLILLGAAGRRKGATAVR